MGAINKSRIKAVIFDVGGVLIENPSKQMFNHYINTLRVDESSFINAFLLNMEPWQKGKSDEATFWEAMSCKLNIQNESHHNLWIEGYAPAYKENEAMVKLLEKLKKLHFLVVLLSNTEKPVADFIKKKIKNVDYEFYSCELGMMKPESGIYSHVLKKLNLKPVQALFIDDRDENVVAAKKVGMAGITFTNAQNLIIHLKKLDIL